MKFTFFLTVVIFLFLSKHVKSSAVAGKNCIIKNLAAEHYYSSCNIPKSQSLGLTSSRGCPVKIRRAKILLLSVLLDDILLLIEFLNGRLYPLHLFRKVIFDDGCILIETVYQLLKTYYMYVKKVQC
jgi:hypothetical protein